MHQRCVARREAAQQRYPVKTRKLRRTAESLWMALARNPAGQVWLAKRPASGIWAGLYCPPCFTSRETLDAALAQAGVHDATHEPVFVHVLTHKDLHIHPVRVGCAGSASLAPGGAWFDEGEWSALGLPAPVRKLLSNA